MELGMVLAIIFTLTALSTKGIGKTIWRMGMEYITIAEDKNTKVNGYKIRGMVMEDFSYLEALYLMVCGKMINLFQERLGTKMAVLIKVKSDNILDLDKEFIHTLISLSIEVNGLTIWNMGMGSIIFQTGTSTGEGFAKI